MCLCTNLQRHLLLPVHDNIDDEDIRYISKSKAAKTKKSNGCCIFCLQTFNETKQSSQSLGDNKLHVHHKLLIFILNKEQSKIFDMPA
jgi:hypothetical protein